MERNTSMKKLYNQPKIQVAHWESMTLMQVASPVGPTDGGGKLNPIETNDQW